MQQRQQQCDRARWRRTGAMNAAPVLAALAVLGGLAVLVSACSVAQPTACIDDSQGCIAARSATLKSLLADKSHSWVARQPAPATYATGVRLFAYRKAKSSLSCKQLSMGAQETGASRQILADGVAGTSKTRVGQIIALSDDVHVELKRERKRRNCGTA